MKKQLVIIGIIILLVSVGLSGCQQLSGETLISDIKAHPNSYINKTVTIRGLNYMVEAVTGLVIVVDKSTDSLPLKISDNVQKPTPFLPTAEYKYTGIVRYGEVVKDAVMLYLEVTKIETT